MTPPRRWNEHCLSHKPVSRPENINRNSHKRREVTFQTSFGLFLFRVHRLPRRKILFYHFVFFRNLQRISQWQRFAQTAIPSVAPVASYIWRPNHTWLFTKNRSDSFTKLRQVQFYEWVAWIFFLGNGRNTPGVIPHLRVQQKRVPSTQITNFEFCNQFALLAIRKCQVSNYQNFVTTSISKRFF